jgi:hypothetical protein
MKTEKIKIDGKNYKLRYVNSLKYNGCSISGIINPKNRIIRIKKSLHPRAKKYVLAHEIYHAKDKARWGGRLGAEIRATIYCGIRDSGGMLMTAFSGNIIKGLSNFFKLYIQK